MEYAKSLEDLVMDLKEFAMNMENGICPTHLDQELYCRIKCDKRCTNEIDGMEVKRHLI